ncbi:transporter%2C divalent anion:Na+ symporter (DASS) family [Campylobacter hyointestinalis subsp. hyointestinalis]|uniref:Transporter, divalent anion:Na+ symporter (DASS) family n=1 Tax=Campylobacter hyointestinalis subsp. hyointestinalis TaxID=91352 RepID=A0A9W5ERD2_CAMHY|nr:transporter%2C divalent anion:Na+ symporter (DASS) family [Campylobacter hyointestinalis subsp. hyointestinalis]CUU76879.1 transporter%2C divalent anion:Na+ symporter (DASS) family [Campylobacter hyointestinalis subsp. hyointestinalis]
MFLTSMAGNPLIASLALTTFGVEISWGLWAMGAIVPVLVSLAVIHYVLYKFYPFASLTAHITAMYATFGAVAIAATLCL